MSTKPLTRSALAKSGRPGGSIFAPRYRVSTLGVIIIMVIVAFEAMAVATALPTAARSLHGLAYYGWSFTGFLVASVVGMVASGWYSDRRGPRVPLLCGLIFFLGGLIVAALASQMWILVAGRVIQGLATGLLITGMYVIIGSLYADEIRPRIFTAVAGAWVVPGLIGPVVAGWVTEHASWRWVFAGLTPFVLLGGALLIPTLRQLGASGAATAAPSRSRKAEYRSGLGRISMALLAAGGIAAIANLGQDQRLVAIGAAVLGSFALVLSLGTLLPTGTVTFRPGVPAAVAFRGLLAGTFYGMEAILPLTLTIQHHYSPTMAGLPLMCSAITWAFGSWIQGRLAAPNRSLLMGGGLALVAAGGLGMAGVAFDVAPGWLAIPSWLLAGLGAGLALTSASVVMLYFTTDAKRGSDSAALQLADSVVSALCAAFAGAMVAAAAHGKISYGTGLGSTYLVLALIAVAAITRAGRLTPRPARSTLQADAGRPGDAGLPRDVGCPVGGVAHRGPVGSAPR